METSRGFRWCSLLVTILVAVLLMPTSLLPVQAANTPTQPAAAPKKDSTSVSPASTTNTYTVTGVSCSSPQVLLGFSLGDQVSISAIMTSTESGETGRFTMLGPSGFQQFISDFGATHGYTFTVNANDRPFSACIDEDGDGDDPDITASITITVAPAPFAKPTIVLEGLQPFTVDGNVIALQFRITCPSSAKCDGIQSIIPIDLDTMTHFVPYAGGWFGVRFPILPLQGGDSLLARWDWNTSSMAWDDSGKTVLRHGQIRIGAIITYTTLPPDPSLSLSTIEMRTKPVILVHGCCGEHASAREGNDGWLFSTGKGFQHLFAADFSSLYAANGMDMTLTASGMSIKDNASKLRDDINAVKQATQADHVDLVTHSLGGLVARYYITQLMGNASDGRPVIHSLIMLGSPNLGSHCAVAGTAVADGTGVADILSLYGVNSLSALVARPGNTLFVASLPGVQLLPLYVRNFFNPQMKDDTAQGRKGVHYFEIYGTGNSPFFGIPFKGQCAVFGPSGGGDGAVAVESAGASQYADSNDSNHIAKMAGLGHNDLMSSQASFDQIKQWLAVGSRKAAQGQAIPSTQTAEPVRSLAAPTSITDITPQFAYGDTVQIPANGSNSAFFTLPAGNGTLTMTMLVPPTVDATLYDPFGTARDSLPAGSSRPDTEPIPLIAPQVSGTWTLRLTNNGTSPVSVPVAAEVDNQDFVFTITRIEQHASSLTLDAIATYRGAPADVASPHLTLQGNNGSFLTDALARTGTGIYTYEADMRFMGTGIFSVALDGQFAGSTRKTAISLGITQASIASVGVRGDNVNQVPLPPGAHVGGPVSGGTPVVITGYSFSPDAVVYFGDELATDAQVVPVGVGSDIKVTAPGQATGKVAITVLVDDGSITWSDAYWYVEPLPPGKRSAPAGQSGAQPQGVGPIPVPIPAPRQPIPAGRNDTQPQAGGAATPMPVPPHR